MARAWGKRSSGSSQVKRVPISWAKRASARRRAGTRRTSSASAPAQPKRTPAAFLPSQRRPRKLPRVRKPARRSPKSPERIRQKRSHSMAGRRQGSLASPEQPAAWRGSRRARAPKFQSRKYQPEPRAYQSPRRMLAVSSHLPLPAVSRPQPRRRPSRAYQASTVTVTPRPRPWSRKLSAASVQTASVRGSRSRSRPVMSYFFTRNAGFWAHRPGPAAGRANFSSIFDSPFPTVPQPGTGPSVTSPPGRKPGCLPAGSPGRRRWPPG